MNKIVLKRHYFSGGLIMLTLLISGCENDNEPEIINLPQIQTLAATNIMITSAMCAGVVIDDGRGFVIERGIIWDTVSLKAQEHINKISAGQDTGRFEVGLTNLLPDQQYFIRAYAENGKGTSYGNEISFTTNKTNSIVYKTDGRTTQDDIPGPIALDINENGIVDFVLFTELTANSTGDRLYAGINPIGPNLMKTGPAINDNFLSMGFIVAENPGVMIDETLLDNERWYTDHAALIIRNTPPTGAIFYEGNWAEGEQIVGIQFFEEQSMHLGWLRIGFDKTTETLTLIDFAYNSIVDQPIIAGAKSNGD
ncbi:MAG: fibronectin type III domain-containing protein [Fulvivirga sp.]|uniref:fibronectin type III domain-containing protein n=1 Tax=Fulvivirga sp. TaxID=1931237 RepID=UPI0032ED6EFC